MIRALFLALLLAGCATVERAPPPALAEATLPPAFALLDRERVEAGSIAALLPRADAAYAELERQALASAPTLEAAVARIDAARAGTRIARAEQLPNISASGTAARERINQQQFGGALPPGIVIDPNRTTYNIALNGSWDADLFGRLRASRRAAAARLDAANADAAGVRLALQADIARAVIDARALDTRETVARRDIANATDLVVVTRIRARAGIAPGFDLVRAQSLEADATARLEPILSQRAAVIGQLVTLTALPAQQVLSTLRLPAGPALGSVPALAVPSVLLRARPDVAAAERRLAAADQEIAAAAAERYPRLSITSALGLFTLGLSNLFDDRSLTGSLGAGIAGPLLDFGRVGARIDQSQAEAREAFADYRRQLFAALGETEAALGAISAADRRAAALERQSAIDADAVTLARERYRRGLDSFLTVIDAERTSLNSRTNAVEGRADAARSRVALYRAAGGEPAAQ
ncbi:efflux transporter outer membrane subunit [Sphingomonas radiodurans]|uniref:efflux transporter outer membrane subunit n=1 Tax=Sphingomonas radiodurans TaxID=2890321 RepID=UPI001E352D78|nr:efflux transporter outer membrane subunit [Sphingomonas radiodurans]WBH15053.1 efflux transporter outer membrane subunit [Sphingomonas radiodurans]